MCRFSDLTGERQSRSQEHNLFLVSSAKMILTRKIYLHGHAAMGEFLNGLADALTFHGVDSEITDVRRELFHSPWIGIWHRAKRIPTNYIAYNSESLRLRHTPFIFANAQEVWDFASSNVPIHQKFGVKNVRLIPMAYSPYYERKFGNRSGDKDIDVLMYGWHSVRRQQVADRLRSCGFSVVWLGENGQHEYSSERDDLIARCKIVVSVCQKDPSIYQTNDFSRLSYLIANRIFTISEPIGDPIVEGIWKDRIVMRRYDEIIEACREYLDDPQSRQRIVDGAYEYAIENFNLRKLIPIDSVLKMISHK